ncbi:aspartyl protease family protein [Riemerella columbina]|uniref:aspartyl protease family protein n=1 Tax=Riemerella columbina TaxID=103810 RepID=UPI00037F0C51|nr:aspartyl protease family protein [Riemerella columbina]
MRILFLSLMISVGMYAQQRPVAIIPFQMHKDKPAVFLNTEINQQPLSFFFDTGATTSLLDTKVAECIGVKANHEQSVSGAGGKKTYKIAQNQKVKIQSIVLDSINFVIDDLAVFKERFHHPFDGIIGHSLLKNYKVIMDFTKQEFQLYDFSTPLPLEGYEEIPFEFGNGIPIPQFNISIKINNESLTGRIFFDSGAGLSLLMNSPFAQKHHLPDSHSKKLTTYTQNLSKESKSIDFIADEIHLGDYTFKNIKIGASSDNTGVSSFPNYLGILGAEIINRFNWVIDYQNHKLYMKPNTNFHKPFPQEYTGFRIKESEGKLYVESLAEESPFYAKGLRNGDQIRCVNGYTNREKIESLLKEKGKKIKLRYIRNGKTQKIKHQLYNLLKP